MRCSAIDLGDTGYASATAAHARRVRRPPLELDRFSHGGHPAGARRDARDRRGAPPAHRRDGDPVVVTAPVYPPFFGFVTHAGRRIVQSGLDSAGWIDFDA